MRCLDVIFAFPGGLAGAGDRGDARAVDLNAMLAITVVGVPSFARLIRASVLSLKEQASRRPGCSGPARAGSIIRHILPNSVSTVIVYGTLEIGKTVVFAAGLSFLGLGVQPPTPEWGRCWPTAARYWPSPRTSRPSRADHLPGDARFQHPRRRPPRRPRSAPAPLNAAELLQEGGVGVQEVLLGRKPYGGLSTQVMSPTAVVCQPSVAYSRRSVANNSCTGAALQHRIELDPIVAAQRFGSPIGAETNDDARLRVDDQRDRRTIRDVAPHFSTRSRTRWLGEAISTAMSAVSGGRSPLRRARCGNRSSGTPPRRAPANRAHRRRAARRRHRESTRPRESIDQLRQARLEEAMLPLWRHLLHHHPVDQLERPASPRAARGTAPASSAAWIAISGLPDIPT